MSHGCGTVDLSTLQILSRFGVVFIAGLIEVVRLHGSRKIVPTLCVQLARNTDLLRRRMVVPNSRLLAKMF